MFVYKTTNLINGKIYIGQSKYNNPDYLGSGIFIKQAVEKYGKVNFSKVILEECESQEITNEKEKFWIKELNSKDKSIGYNVADGGSSFIMNKEISEKISKTLKGKYTGENSFRYGIEITEDHKKIISFHNKGKKLTEETRKKMSNSKKGITFSEESRKKMSESHSNKPLKEEHKKNISNSLRGRKVKEETKNILRDKNINKTQKNSLKVFAIRILDNFSIDFNNCSEASRYFKCTRQRIKNNKIEGWQLKTQK